MRVEVFKCDVCGNDKKVEEWAHVAALCDATHARDQHVPTSGAKLRLIRPPGVGAQASSVFQVDICSRECAGIWMFGPLEKKEAKKP